jgi:hypothetical protein
VTEAEQPERVSSRTTFRTKSRAKTTDRTTAVTEPTPARSDEGIEPAPKPRAPVGRIGLGLILLAIGLGWLLQSLDVIEIPWDALLPVALIAVGVASVVGSRTGRHSGLIVLGIVLTLVTAMTAAVDVPLIGGAGQREYAPLTASDVEPRYDLAVGQLVIDLSALTLQPGERVDVEARVGLGELVVEVPTGVLIEAHARAGLGDVEVLGRQASGFGPEQTVGPRIPGFSRTEPSHLSLDLSVGMGSVKVND